MAAQWVERSHGFDSATVGGLQTTWAKFCKAQGKRVQRDVTHVCGRGCRYWTHPRARDYYLCRASCRVHVCGEQCAAPSLQTKESTHVCSLTGLETEGCSLVTTFRDVERVLPPGLTNHARERKQTARVVTAKNVEKRLRESLGASPTAAQISVFARICTRGYAAACAATTGWDKSCTRSVKLFALAMVLELRSARNPILGKGVEWLQESDFSQVQAACRGLPHLNKMQKKLKKVMQDKRFCAELRRIFEHVGD